MQKSPKTNKRPARGRILKSPGAHIKELGVAYSALYGNENSRKFQIVSRLLYHCSMVVYIFVQTLWLHLINIYDLKPRTLKQRFFSALAFLHIIVLNLVIYMKTTLDEAQHSWEHVESQESNGGHDGQENSGADENRQNSVGTDEKFVEIRSCHKKIQGFNQG